MISVVSRYIIKKQKPVAFLYTNNEPSEKEIKKTSPFTTVSKTIKYSGIKLTREVKDLYTEIYMTKMRNTEEKNK